MRGGGIPQGLKKAGGDVCIETTLILGLNLYEFSKSSFLQAQRIRRFPREKRQGTGRGHQRGAGSTQCQLGRSQHLQSGLGAGPSARVLRLSHQPCDSSPWEPAPNIPLPWLFPTLPNHTDHTTSHPPRPNFLQSWADVGLLDRVPVNQGLLNYCGVGGRGVESQPRKPSRFQWGKSKGKIILKLWTLLEHKKYLM